jgi:hypothetical protein
MLWQASAAIRGLTNMAKVGARLAILANLLRNRHKGLAWDRVSNRPTKRTPLH